MSNEDYAKDARFDGKHARRTGRPQSDNPHPTGTMEHNVWNDGWNAEDRRVRAIMSDRMTVIRRERETEARIRAMDAVDIVAEVHQHEDLRATLLEALENIENDNEHMPDSAWQMIQAAIAKAGEG